MLKHLDTKDVAILTDRMMYCRCEILDYFDNELAIHKIFSAQTKAVCT